MNFVNSKLLQPHPIWGTATYEGGGYAVGAYVAVISSLGTLTDTVGSSGEWQVDCGSPGAEWPEGTPFTVTITGRDIHKDWFGSKSGVVSGGYNNMGNIVLYARIEADAHGPYSAIADDQIQFTGSVRYGKPPYSWHWNFGDGSIAFEQNPIHEYATDGTFGVMLTVTDSNGKSDEDSTWAEIIPELKAEANGPYTGMVDTPIQFYGYASGGAPSYPWWIWEFGDGKTSPEQNPTYVYTEPGNYTIRLTVYDIEYHIANDTTWAVIGQENSPPNIPSLSGPIRGKAGIEYEYETSTTDPDGDHIWYWFDWDGGANSGWIGPHASGESSSASHTWKELGDYTIRVKAKDELGVESPWSDPLSITMPKNRIANRYLLLMLFEKIIDGEVIL